MFSLTQLIVFVLRSAVRCVGSLVVVLRLCWFDCCDLVLGVSYLCTIGIQFFCAPHAWEVPESSAKWILALDFFEKGSTRIF